MHAAAFLILCNGLVAEAGSPAKSELQMSRWEMTSAWTRSCVASFVRKDRILRMLLRANLKYQATAVMLGAQDSPALRITPRFLTVPRKAIP